MRRLDLTQFMLLSIKWVHSSRHSLNRVWLSAPVLSPCLCGETHTYAVSCYCLWTAATKATARIATCTPSQEETLKVSLQIYSLILRHAHQVFHCLRHKLGFSEVCFLLHYAPMLSLLWSTSKNLSTTLQLCWLKPIVLYCLMKDSKVYLKCRKTLWTHCDSPLFCRSMLPLSLLVM